MRNLLAKSKDARLSEYHRTLAGHLLRVDEVARTLGVAMRDDLMLTFGWTPVEYDRFFKLAVLASVLHDIGKASDSFQGMLTKTCRSVYRHEIVSAILIVTPGVLNTWLRERHSDEDVRLIAIAVAAHHLASTSVAYQQGGQDVVKLGVASLNQVWRHLGIDHRVPSVRVTSEMAHAAYSGPLSLPLSPEAMRLLPLLKAFVICADTLGSAHPSNGASIAEVVCDAMDQRLSVHEIDSIVRKVLTPGADARGFQVAIRNSTSDTTLVTAGCGNGKTLAAYLWMRQYAGRSLIFCYPTMGTASVGYESYLLSHGDLGFLVHSRSKIDLERLQNDLEEEPASPDDPKVNRRVMLRWFMKLVVCTVDTVLSLMVNDREALCALPLFVRSVFVFDEVHLYDRKMFGHLLDFLAFVKAPVLLMTASLSEARRQAIRRVRPNLVVIGGDPSIEAVPRYVFQRSEVGPAIEQVVKAAQAGGHVLWVANTVQRACEAFRKLKASYPNTLLFHARFRYVDRIQRQEEVLNAFKDKTQGVIVVATQICEVSLDINADLLVTEAADISAIIQRAGRLNRSAATDEVRLCLVLDVQDSAPYEKESISAFYEKMLWGQPLTQSDLAAILQTVTEGDFTSAASPFLTDTVETTDISSVRALGSTLQVVRHEDALATQRRASKNVLQRLTIPMPFKRDRLPPVRRVHGIEIVAKGQIDYHNEEGASWAN